MSDNWATELVDERAWVLHRPTQTLGRVKAYYDGVERAYEREHVEDLGDGKFQRSLVQTKGAVLEFEEGHSFVAREDSFVKLEANEFEYYMGALRFLGESLKICAVKGAEAGLRRETGFLLLELALKEQVKVVVQTRQKETP